MKGFGFRSGLDLETPLPFFKHLSFSKYASNCTERMTASFASHKCSTESRTNEETMRGNSAYLAPQAGQCSWAAPTRKAAARISVDQHEKRLKRPVPGPPFAVAPVMK